MSRRQAGDDAVRALNIFGEETCREAKFRSICALNDFLLIVEAEDTHHRTEDFFSTIFIESLQLLKMVGRKNDPPLQPATSTVSPP